jgi:hypothetical protein
VRALLTAIAFLSGFTAVILIGTSPAVAAPLPAVAAPQSAPSQTNENVEGGDPIELGEVDQPVGGIIPQPNSGASPAVAGDRGGPEQWLLLGLILAFFAVATTSVIRTARRTQAARAAMSEPPA